MLCRISRSEFRDWNHIAFYFPSAGKNTSSSSSSVANATDVLQPSRLIALTLSPTACLDIPTFAARYPHVHNDARDPTSERWNCVGENWPVILPEIATSGIFYMPQICDMGPTALLPFWRKACRGFYHPEKFRRLRPGLNPRAWVLKGSTLPLDHRSH